MQIYIWSGLFSFIANLVIGLAVLARNPRDRIHRYFTLFSLGVSFWSAGSFLENIIPDQSIALQVLRINYFFGVWLPPFYIHFLYAFGHEDSASLKRLLRCGYVVSLLLSFFVFTPLFIQGLQPIGAADFLISKPGPLYYVFFAFFAFCMAEVMRYTWTKFSDRRSEKSVWGWIAFANTLAVFAGFEYFSKVFGISNNPPVDDYILVLYVIVLAFAMVRYGLFDAGTLVAMIQKERLAMLGLLSASVNHEIKNPLYIMRGQFDLLRQLESGSKDGRVSRCLEQMDNQIQRIQKLLKMYSGDASQDSSTGVSLQESLKNVIEFLDFEIKRRSIEIECNAEESLPFVRGARFELESVILNLMLNACQAIGVDGKITLRTKVTEDSVCLCVKDTGPGLTREQQRRLFEPLYTTKPEGGGLGLFITKSMVEKHGGSLKVISEPGQGALFEISLRRSSQSV